MTLKHSESGRSLLETLAVLVIIAILLLASILAYELVVHKYKKDQTVKSISELAVRYKLQPISGEDIKIKDVYPEAERADAMNMRTMDTPTGRVQLKASSTTSFSVVVNDVLEDTCKSTLENGVYDAVFAPNINENLLNSLHIRKKSNTDIIVLGKDFLNGLERNQKEEVLESICGGDLSKFSLAFGGRCSEMGYAYHYKGQCWHCPEGEVEITVNGKTQCCPKENINDCGVCEADSAGHQFKYCRESDHTNCTYESFCDTTLKQCVECVNDGDECCGDNEGKFCSNKHCCPEGRVWGGTKCVCPDDTETCGTNCCSEATPNCVISGANETCCETDGKDGKACNKDDCCESGSCIDKKCCPKDRVYEKDDANHCCSQDLVGGVCPDCPNGCNFNNTCYPVGQVVDCGKCKADGSIEEDTTKSKNCHKCNTTTWQWEVDTTQNGKAISTDANNCGKCNAEGSGLVEESTNGNVCQTCSKGPNWILGWTNSVKQNVVATKSGEKCCKNDGSEGSDCSDDSACCVSWLICASDKKCHECDTDEDCEGTKVCDPEKKCVDPDPVCVTLKETKKTINGKQVSFYELPSNCTGNTCSGCFKSTLREAPYYYTCTKGTKGYECSLGDSAEGGKTFCGYCKDGNLGIDDCSGYCIPDHCGTMDQKYVAEHQGDTLTDDHPAFDSGRSPSTYGTNILTYGLKAQHKVGRGCTVHRKSDGVSYYCTKADRSGYDYMCAKGGTTQIAFYSKIWGYHSWGYPTSSNCPMITEDASAGARDVTRGEYAQVSGHIWGCKIYRKRRYSDGTYSNEYAGPLYCTESVRRHKLTSTSSWYCQTEQTEEDKQSVCHEEGQKASCSTTQADGSYTGGKQSFKDNVCEWQEKCYPTCFDKNSEGYSILHKIQAVHPDFASDNGKDGICRDTVIDSVENVAFKGTTCDGKTKGCCWNDRLAKDNTTCCGTNIWPDKNGGCTLCHYHWECQASGLGNVCSDGNGCNNGKRCDEGHCCPSAKPYWNGKKCVECLQDSDCGGTKYCGDDGTCKQTEQVSVSYYCNTFNQGIPHWKGKTCTMTFTFPRASGRYQVISGSANLSGSVQFGWCSTRSRDFSIGPGTVFNFGNSTFTGYSGADYHDAGCYQQHGQNFVAQITRNTSAKTLTVQITSGTHINGSVSVSASADSKIRVKPL